MSSDPRFARLATDPRFRRPKQKQLKVQLDDRFKEVLQSEEFAEGGGKKGKGKQTDKYGRPLGKAHHAEQLKKFYRLKSPSPGADGEGAPAFVDYARGEGVLESSGDEDDDEEEDSDDDDDEVEVGAKRRVTLPRRAADESTEESESESVGQEDHLDINLSEDDEEDVTAALEAAKAAAAARQAAKGKSKANESAFPPEADEVPPSDEEEEEERIEPTKRIAIVNMDWDNLQARDLYKVFLSFLNAANQPTAKKSAASSSASGETFRGGLMHVRVYPSEFGKERMEREEREGPAADVFRSIASSSRGKPQRQKPQGKRQEEELESDEDEEDDEDAEDDEDDDMQDDELDNDQSDEDVVDDGSASGSAEDDEDDDASIASSAPSDRSEEVDMDKLRAYQLERLRYFYAIATFSDPSAAAYIMKECNGAEFERTANVLDLSFVPDDMEFDDDWRDEANEDPKAYKGIDFVTDALRHSKVKLTWDQDDPNRQKVLRRPLTKQEIDEDDFKAYLAASSDESEDESDMGGDGPGLSAKEKKARRKEKTEQLRQLLLGGGDDTEDVWGKHTDLQDGDEDAPKDMEITFKSALTTSSKALDDDDNLTTLERYQRRMKEKKERKKEKKELKAGSRAAVAPEVERAAPKADRDDFFGESDEEDTLAATVTATKTATPPPPEASEVPDETRHFSMQDILKAEKQEGKKKKSRHKKKSKYEDEKEPQLGDEDFAINVRDNRFKAIHEEPEFAIDPSDPHFKKTKAMSQLLAERTKRRQEAANAAPSEVARAAKQPTKGPSQPTSDSMADLVASVKRKFEGDATQGGGSKNRHRKRSKK